MSTRRRLHDGHIIRLRNTVPDMHFRRQATKHSMQLRRPKPVLLFT